MILIDGDALKESLKQSRDACKKWFDNCDSDMKPRVEQALITFMECIIRVNDAPTVEERKKGKWIEYDSDEDKYDIIKCPCCKNTFTVDSYHWTDIGFIKDDFKFCPNCGADMRGEKT